MRTAVHRAVLHSSNWLHEVYRVGIDIRETIVQIICIMDEIADSLPISQTISNAIRVSVDYVKAISNLVEPDYLLVVSRLISGNSTVLVASL